MQERQEINRIDDICEERGKSLFKLHFLCSYKFHFNHKNSQWLIILKRNVKKKNVKFDIYKIKYQSHVYR